MKKILPYILMLTLITSMLAPFSVGVNEKKQIKIEKNVANADYDGCPNPNDISNVGTQGKTFPCEEKWATNHTELLNISPNLIRETSIGVDVNISNPETIKLLTLSISDTNKTTTTITDFTKSPLFTFIGLTPGTDYTITATITYGTITSAAGNIYTGTINPKVLTPRVITTTTSGSDAKIVQDAVDADKPKTSSDVPEYACGVAGIGGTLLGCISKITYLVFRLSAWLFAAAGRFFDFTFGYSIQDTSYRMSFITEGWKLIRDFVNMFFIFVLLYAAISIILGLNHGESKKIIINVVIVGLLINFSLFATQIIVDASNILARVFYNQIIIEGTSTDTSQTGVANVNPIDKNYKSISAGLVNKINPQVLITKAENINIANEKNDQTYKSSSGNSIGVGSFILITILATAICFIGMMVFFTTGLIFLARVIGLALAMIFAPIAFFSYTVPKMRDIDTIGIHKWFPDTLKLAFLAPIFIFFLYLIIKFVQTGLGLGDVENASGIQLVLLIIIPFAFIMILLKKAGSIAEKMSGEMGQAITSSLKVAGGIAIGGAALGAAALGRGVIGGTMKMAQNDTARKNALKFTDTKTAWQKSKQQWYNPFAHINTLGKAISGTGKAAVAGAGYGLSRIGRKTDIHGKETSWVQRSEKTVAEKQHSEHVLNDIAKKKYSSIPGYGENITYAKLTETEQQKVRIDVDKDNLARKVTGTNFENVKDETTKQRILTSVENFHTRGETGELQTEDIDPTTGIQRTDPTTGNNLFKTADHSALEMASFAKASAGVGEFVSALRKGSYDVRNISQLKSSNKGFAKMGVGLIAGVAAGVRMGLKQGMGVEHGKGQKDFFTDLGHTITEALKTMKIKTEGVGGGHAPAVKNIGGGGGGGHH